MLAPRPRCLGLLSLRRSRPRTSARSVLPIGSVLALLTLGGIARAFTSFQPPLVGSIDFVTGAPSCTISSGRAGPVGLVLDSSHFFTTDYCTHTTYRFSLGGGDFSSPEASADNGLTHGLAVSGGHYYGLAGGNSNIAQGLYSFDPVTLAVVGPMIAPFADPLALVVDPVSPDPTNPDLFVSTSSGVFRVHNPSSAPMVTPFASGNFDGLYFTSDGSRLYVAEVSLQHISGFDRSGVQVLDADLSGHGPDGVAVAKNNAVIAGIDVSNNIFVNCNDGTIERIDVNRGNAVSAVAIGGSRGDFVTVGEDNCLYATQSNKIARLTPCFFEPPTRLCAPVPVIGCQASAARKASLIVHKGRTGRKNALGWKWMGSGAVKVSDFGTPTTSTEYVLCLYDNVGLEISARAPAELACRKKPCWKALGGNGFKYRDKAGRLDGLTVLRLRAGVAGKAKIAMQGKGANLSVPSLPLTPPVRVQLKRGDTGECWEATYSHVLVNSAGKGFNAKSD